MSSMDSTRPGVIAGRSDAWGASAIAPMSRVLGTIGVTYLLLLLVSATNLADPFLRNDDYLALLALPDGFYSKTLHEGRWLNYWWHLRGIVTPAWLNFALYQLFWAAFCGATAIIACGRGATWRTVLTLSGLLALSVPALLISLWFNTLLPGIAILALYAVLATQVSQRVSRLLLLIFVPITLTAYTTYPILLLCLCLAARDTRRSWTDLATVLCLFGLAFGLGIVGIYTLNLIEHGIFGIPMAEWRDPRPATDWASLMANTRMLAQSMWDGALAAGFQNTTVTVVGIALFLGAMVVLARTDRWSALYLMTGLGAGLALLSLQVLLTGITLPHRTLGFACMIAAIAVVRAQLEAQEHGLPSARALQLGALTILAAHAILTPKQYASYLPWQQETRAMADILNAGHGPLYVTGDYDALNSARSAHLQAPQALRLRLYHLTGRRIVVCSETPDRCGSFAPYDGPRPHMVQGDDAMVLYLPVKAESPDG